MDKIEKTVCYNCELPVSPNDNYCSHCGQANHPTKLTISVLVKDFVINFFNLDSKFFKTFKHIYSPTFLTREYLAGKRKSYANPIRLFIIMMFVFFAVLAYTLNVYLNIDRVDKAKFEFDSSLAQSEVFDNYKNYVDTIDLSEQNKAFSDSIEKHVFANISLSDSNYLDLTNSDFSGVDMKKAKFLRRDVIELSIDSLYKKYEIEEFWDQVVIKQIIKTITNPASSIRTLIGNSFWIIILIIIAISFLMKLLYIRHKIYLLEHIILQSNLHSFVFLILTISLLFYHLLEFDTIIFKFLIFLIAIISVVTFKRYYKQGILKTIVKSLIYFASYFFMLIFCTFFVALVSFILL